MYDESTGLPMKMPGGKEIPRDPRSLPCRMAGEYNGTACPKGSPAAGVSLTPQNLAAYRHYQRCKAVGRFPEDSLVEQHAQVISEIEAQWDRLNSHRLAATLMAGQRS